MKAKGAVACGHPETANAAAEILAEGGNAFDAVLAAFGAATVAEPVLASLGGGGFLMAQPHDGPALVYDFFVDTPLQWRPSGELDFFPVHADFGVTTQEFHIGLGAAAIPGAVKGLFAIHRDLASLPMARLLEPAIALAREGSAVRPIDAYLFTVVAPILMARPEVRALYCDETGSLLTAGATLKQPDLAQGLEALAREGQDLFYRGSFAQRLIEICRSGGGQITAADLERYRVARRPPLRRHYGGCEILTNPPPSAGGILIALALDLLAAHDLRRLGPREGGALLARVMTATGQARRELGLDRRLAGDPDGTMAALADPDLVARYRQEVLPHRSAQRGTTHVSVVDAAGNLAAMTLSNGEGCAEILPGSGIVLNNMLGEEDLNPSGFHRGDPGQRLSSMMAPSLAHLPDGSLVALGSGGSNRIRSAILQVLLRLIHEDVALPDAVSAARLHVERGQANLEQGLPEGLGEVLQAQGLEVTDWPAGNLFFGGVHAVMRHPDGRFEAAGDQRRGGVGLVIK